MHLIDTLRELCEMPGPSGFECLVAERAVSLLREVMDEAALDRFGNAVGVRRCGKPNAPKVLLDAHLDEVGLMITGIKDGFLQFGTIGGVDIRMLPDREVTILTEPPIFGLVTCYPPHLLSKNDTDKSISLSDLFLDVGMDQGQAESRISVGTPVVFRSTFCTLKNGLVSSKALDDRSGFTALLRTAELLREQKLGVDLYLMGSTREEVGGSGGAVGTYTIAPDYCIAVDVTHGKTPDGPKESVFDLGVGPVIGIGPNMNRKLTQQIIACAENLQYTWQAEVMTGHSGTNAWRMQIAREGIATAVVSIPLKYMHSPVEVIDQKDVESVANLLAEWLKTLGEEGGDGQC